jgi:hypothetical protein
MREHRGQNRNNNNEKTDGKMQFHAAAKLIDSKGSHSGAGHFVIERAFVER